VPFLSDQQSAGWPPLKAPAIGSRSVVTSFPATKFQIMFLYNFQTAGLFSLLLSRFYPPPAPTPFVSIGKSRGPIQFCAPAAGTLEVLVTGKQHMAALFADKPLWALPHRPELIAQKTIRATHHLLSHFTPPLVTDSLSFGAS